MTIYRFIVKVLYIGNYKQFSLKNSYTYSRNQKVNICDGNYAVITNCLMLWLLITVVS